MAPMELLIGDPAPEIRIETFLKGEPVSGFAPGVTHVVEFWATWCGPCKASIPHLSDLQARHPQIPVIGIAVAWKDLEVVRAFVQERDSEIGYRIAVDLAQGEGAGRGWMREAWCDAAYEPGVPTAFIVDGAGRIAWIGHPMELDSPLAAVIDGSWDLPAVAEAHRQRLVHDKVREARALERAIKACFDAGDRDGALRAYDEAFAAEPALERTHGFGRFKQLEPGSEAALAYGLHLISDAASEDINTLFKLGTVLSGQAEEMTGAPSRRVAFLAMEALEQVWLLVGDEPSAALRMRLSLAHARALLAAERFGEADSRARAAREAADKIGAPEATKAEIDAVLKRCATSAPPRRAPPPAVICEGDSCRLADT